MASRISKTGGQIAWYGFGLFMFFFYWAISLVTGSFFSKESEKQRLELAIARDKIWNIGKQYLGFSHCFYVLKNGLKLHYVTNNEERLGAPKPLVILIHGWPDSYSIWRFVLESQILREESTIVAVDLPGFGGSDSFPPYSATVVLEALAEFIIGMREKYNVANDSDSGVDTDNGASQSKVYIVGHDWGCIMACRLCSEAPALADRFILTNGPLPELAFANKDRMLGFANKMFHAFYQSPMQCRHCLFKAFSSIGPLARQSFALGYAVAFHLPSIFVHYLLTGGNRAFVRGIHQYASGANNSQLDSASYLAGVLGPSLQECKTSTLSKNGHEVPEIITYPASVAHRAAQATNLYESTNYYRSGALSDRWEKSLETIAALYDIEISHGNLKSRRHSSGAGLLGEHYNGALRGPATYVWGQQDPVLTQKICLDGIGDYLAKGSQVILLPRTGHWTPFEVEGRVALRRVIEWAVQGEKIETIGTVVSEVYEGAHISVKR